jgi:hypothetical protein
MQWPWWQSFAREFDSDPRRLKIALMQRDCVAEYGDAGKIFQDALTERLAR